MLITTYTSRKAANRFSPNRAKSTISFSIEGQIQKGVNNLEQFIFSYNLQVFIIRNFSFM